MIRKLVAISADERQLARLKSALAGEFDVIALDPRQQDEGLIRQLSPDAIVFDASTSHGIKTVLERISAIRALCRDLPLLAIGDELSAQLVLATFRAGVDNFIDRDAQESELRNGIIMTVSDRKQGNDTPIPNILLSILSSSSSEEDGDLALNLALLLADAQPDRRTLLIDLSASGDVARTALGLEPHLSTAAAIRDMARLDWAFLESALACEQKSGLFVMPLREDDATSAPAYHDLSALVKILRNIFDAIVVRWSGYSAELTRRGEECGVALLSCNQRFSSIRNACELFTNLKTASAGWTPILAIHLFDQAMVPSPAEIIEAVGAKQVVTLRVTWQALALSHNSGKPLALASTNPYASALRSQLAEKGFLLSSTKTNHTLNLLHWLRRAQG